jgi:hypothetical protein
MAAAVALSLAIAVFAIATRGAGEHGIDRALFLTGRVNFLLFWLSYAGGALASLFGDRFRLLRRYGREFGLAFAAALLVHLGLVAWLCGIGATPSAATFVLFGTASACVYAMALFSLGPLQRAIGARGWWLLRTIAMNVVAYAFAADFLGDPFGGSPARILAYLPFAALALLGPALRLAAFLCRIGETRGAWA